MEVRRRDLDLFQPLILCQKLFFVQQAVVIGVTYQSPGERGGRNLFPEGTQ